MIFMKSTLCLVSGGLLLPAMIVSMSIEAAGGPAGPVCQASSTIQNCRATIALQGRKKDMRIEFDLRSGKGQIADLISGKVITFSIYDSSMNGRSNFGGNQANPGSGSRDTARSLKTWRSLEEKCADGEPRFTQKVGNVSGRLSVPRNRENPRSFHGPRKDSSRLFE